MSHSFKYVTMDDIKGLPSAKKIIREMFDELIDHLDEQEAKMMEKTNNSSNLDLGKHKETSQNRW